jgi:glutaredoxin
MKWIIRLFFRTVRRIIGPIMLLADRLTTPRGIERPAAEQRRLDEATQQLALYQFKTCPFCMKVRREMKRLSLEIELRDAQHDTRYRSELKQGGGKVKVPCLRVERENGDESWIYESDNVIKYLRNLAA